MAVSITITEEMTELWDAEATTGWTGSLSTFSGFQREGTNCLGMVVSNELEYAYVTGLTSFNITTNKLYIWMNPRGEMDTFANGGIRMVIGDGTNRIGYYVGGSDNWPAFVVNGWYCYVLDGNNLPTNFDEAAGSEASLDLTAITVAGVGFKTLAKSLGNVENCFVDIGRQGTGLNIKGGTSGDPGTWAEIAADDASIADGKAYGIVMEFQPGVYGVQGDVIFGDDTGTTTTYFKDANAVVVILDTGGAAYNIGAVGNTTGTNTFIDGVVVGTGDTKTGRSGSTYINAGPQVTVDFSDANVDAFTLYGTKFQGIDQGISFSSDTNHVLAGCTFQQSGQVDVGAVEVRNCVFSETTATDAALLWSSSIDIKNSSFIANTTGAGIEHTTATGSPFTYDNLTFSGNTYDVNNTSGSAITVSIINTPANYATTYTGSLVTFTISVSVTFIGIATNSEVTITKRGTAVDSGSDGSSTVGSRNFVTTNAWTTDEHRGEILEITSGADAGRYYVTGNSATTLYLDQALTATASSLTWEIYDENDDTEAYHVESSSGDVVYSYTSGAGTDVDVLIFHVDYQDYVIEAYTLPSANASLPIAQIPDVNYYNP